MEAVAPEYLSAMPLHAITEVYGEAGLRQRFALEIARYPDDMRGRLEDALALASALHIRDRRTREPYVNHLLRSAIRVMCHYRVDDVDVIVATLLHDAVEDHPDELAVGHHNDDTTEAALSALAVRFNARVAGLVRAVTNPAYEPDRDHHEQYREHVAHSLDDNPWARVIKVSDFTDNGVGLIHAQPGPRLGTLARKYRPLVPILRELVARPDTPLSDDVKQHVLEQLDAAEERFDAILRSH